MNFVALKVNKFKIPLLESEELYQKALLYQKPIIIVDLKDHIVKKEDVEWDHTRLFIVVEKYSGTTYLMREYVFDDGEVSFSGDEIILKEVKMTPPATLKDLLNFYPVQIEDVISIFSLEKF